MSDYILEHCDSISKENLILWFPKSQIAKDKDVDDTFVRQETKRIRNAHIECRDKEECRKYLDYGKSYYLICERNELEEFANNYKRKG